MEKKAVDFMAPAERAMEQIRRGAFLTVKAGEAINTMTIGWALAGICWQRPIMMVAVRTSRHTFGIMEAASDFTVSVPWDDRAKALAFCGSKSGRDFDKFAECHLDLVEAEKTETPIISMEGLHYECRIVLKSPMDPALMDPALEALYPMPDHHTLYFGEIVACYETSRA